MLAKIMKQGSCVYQFDYNEMFRGNYWRIFFLADYSDEYLNMYNFQDIYDLEMYDDSGALIERIPKVFFIIFKLLQKPDHFNRVFTFYKIQEE